MTRGWPRLLLTALLWLCAGPLRAAGIDLVDDRGVRVHWDAPPQRVVSLLPSLTETVHALGQSHRLVGVDRYSNWPAGIAHLPRVGGGIDPDIEAIVALRPDVVLMAPSSRGVQRLESLGLRVLALSPETTADARRVALQVGQLLGVPDPGRVWRAIDAGVAEVARSLPARAVPLRAYFEVSSGGYAAGPASFIGELMQRLGLQNIVAPELGAFPRINPEYVVRANPDLILIGERHASGLAQRPGWAGLRALRERRLCVFSAAESDVLVRPGPRMDEAARLMARCIRERGTP